MLLRFIVVLLTEKRPKLYTISVLFLKSNYFLWKTRPINNSGFLMKKRTCVIDLRDPTNQEKKKPCRPLKENKIHFIPEEPLRSMPHKTTICTTTS
jgi:hypothetical protein